MLIQSSECLYMILCVYVCGVGEVASRLRLEKDTDTLIEVMRSECYLLLKGPQKYMLHTA